MPRIHYLCHDNSRPSGGVRTIYHHVHHLVESGFDASVVHFKPGFKIEWFGQDVPVIDGSRDLRVTHHDWVVIPDDLPAALESFNKVQCHKAVFCQGHFHIFHHLPMEKTWTDYGVETILGSSREIGKFVHFVFGLESTNIPAAIDHNLYTPDPKVRRLQIAYMPRKGSWNIRQVRGILWHRCPALRSIPWIPIENMSESETAKTLQESALFLSTSFREGFGLPPLEAMACGCIVVGFTGGGGKEYARDANGFWVADEDPIGLADTLEKVLNDLCQDPGNPIWGSIRQEAYETASRYNLGRQRDSLVRFWTRKVSEGEKVKCLSEKPLYNRTLELNYFEKNLHVLAERYPKIAKELNDVRIPDKISVERSIEGLPVLRMTNNRNEQIFLYDRLNVWHKIKKELQGVIFSAEDATLLMGFGLGYHVEEIARKMEIDHQLFVIEPCPEVFKLALSSRDVRSLLSNERIQFFVGANPEKLHEALEYHLLRIVAGHLNEITLTPLKEMFQKIYAEVEDRVHKVLLHLEFSYRHCIGNADLLKNILHNAADLHTAIDVKYLFGITRGEPAVIVSGGPSLSKNIGLLRRAKGKVCIIAVDTALKPLLNEGIRPDFVVTADPFEQNFRKIEALPKFISIPLVFEPGVYYKIPNHFAGPKFVTGSLNSLSRWLFSLINYGESLGKATSAAHLAFFLAREMGSDPIIFVGLDLSFPDKSHHAQGAAYTWAPGKDQEYVQVPDIFGGKVNTLPGFQAMIGLFEAEVAHTGARCIDATEGGALIRGTEVMSLDSALNHFAADSHIDCSGKLKGVLRGFSPEAREKIIGGLTLLLEETRSVLGIVQNGLPLIELAKRLVNKGSFKDKRFSDLANKIQQLDKRFAQKKLFDAVMKDFQAELFMYQYLQGYKIKRASERQMSLMLSLESIEQTFLDSKRLAAQVTSILDLVFQEKVLDTGHKKYKQKKVVAG